MHPPQVNHALLSITIKIHKYCDYVSIAAGYGLLEGDALIVRGKSYNIIAVTDDDASTFTPNTRNIIRVDRDFVNNCSNQKLRYRRPPKDVGKIVKLPYVDILPHHKVTVQYKANKNSYSIY